MTADNRENRAAWVLTGGRSRRMGTDKALLEIGGRALARRVADEAAKICGTVSLVGNPSLYRAIGLPVIPDTYPGQGPLAGIEAALGATDVDRNLVIACDMPALGSGVMEELFEMEGDCVVPQYEDGRVEPACAVFHRRCHGTVRAALESGVRKVTDGLRRLEAEGFAIRYRRMASEDPFANLNTPEEMRRYLNG